MTQPTTTRADRTDARAATRAAALRGTSAHAFGTALLGTALLVTAGVHGAAAPASLHTASPARHAVRAVAPTAPRLVASVTALRLPPGATRETPAWRITVRWTAGTRGRSPVSARVFATGWRAPLAPRVASIRQAGSWSFDVPVGYFAAGEPRPSTYLFRYTATSAAGTSTSTTDVDVPQVDRLS